MTINETIALMSQLKIRVAEFTKLRSKVSTQDTHWLGDQSKKTIDPQYDVKKVDHQIVQLQNWIFKIDAQIKKVNAMTDLGMEIPVEDLLKPLD